MSADVGGILPKETTQESCFLHVVGAEQVTCNAINSLGEQPLAGVC